MNLQRSATTQSALVTGGTGGLGTAICQRLSEAGYAVIANYHPADKEQAIAWRKDQQQNGYSIELAAADVSDYAACEAMAAELAASMPIDVLVNNAGIVRDATLVKLEPHHWQSVIDTNLGSMYNVSRQFTPAMIDAGAGRIINIASVNGQRGQFGQTNYSAAKAGVHGFINTISPGFIQTEMVKTIPQEMRDKIVAAIPTRRIGQPQDIANAVAFLASSDSSYITGVNLPVNGGVFMH